MRIFTRLATTRTTVQGYCVLIAVLGTACSRKNGSGQSFGAASASAPLPAASGRLERPRLSCKNSGTSFSLGPVDNGASNNDEESESQQTEDLPFAVTVGSAVAHPNGYLVAAIDARDGGSHSVLAWLDREVSRGAVLDLGRVYGDAEPPRIIVRGDEGFFVASDTDASGKLYRYGWIRGLPSQPRIDWLSSFEQAIDGSPGYALAGNDESSIVAWDELERDTHRSKVLWAALDKSGHPIATAARISTRGKPERAADWTLQSTERETDAESPQIGAFGSGYWLAYLASEATKPLALKRAVDKLAVPSAAPGEDEEPRAIDLGRRGIWLQPLDARGQSKGKPVQVTARGARVVAYDLEATGDGGAVVAYRDADSAPGVEAQSIEVVRVRPDGGLERHRVDDERVGVGMPLLLGDSDLGASPPGARSVWISFAGSNGETKLAELATTAPPVLEVIEEANLAGVDLLLRRGSSLLVARHRARLVSFERMDCVWPDGRFEDKH